MKRIHGLILAIAFTLTVILMPPMSFSAPLPRTYQVCEECHSNFNAFTLIIDAPKEVPETYDFDYNVIVKNREEHTVQGLEAILDLSNAPNIVSTLVGEPYHEEISGSVSVGGTEAYTFPVEQGASSALITLDGDEGLFGRNDIDLTVTGASGEVWESTSPGADEQYELDSGDLRRGGVGDYTVEVAYFFGGPNSFTLEIDVEYSLNQILLEGPDLAPGEEHTFIWPLRSLAKGDNTINVTVRGTAYHEHSDNEDPLISDSDEYTYRDASQVKVGDKYVYQPPEEDSPIRIDILLLERITGILAGVLLLLSIAMCGYFKPLCSTVEKITAGRANRCKWHCRVSLLLLLIAIIHGMLMPFSPHASSLRGLLPGIPALAILGFLGYIGWQQKPLKKRWGNERWKMVHLLLTIMVVVIVVVHAVLDGSDFSWLR